jgi:hypothetical protein
VDEARKAGAIKNTPPDVAAQVLTALVDGYLFQSLEENVDATQTLDRAWLREAPRDVTLTGLAARGAARRGRG